jgi:plastocyanin
MIRLRIAAATVAVLATAATASAAGTEPVPDRVQVRGSEFDLTLSKQRLRPGRDIVQFLNDGEDPHDLKLQRVGPNGASEGPELSIGVVGPGEYENLEAHFKKASTYVFWCSLSDHRQRGMEATLRTKKRRG